MALAIRGETTTGAAVGRSASMHLPAGAPTAPSGGDAKSAAIGSALKAGVTTDKAEVKTLNSSVDQLREGLVAAPQRVEAADQQGAGEVEKSGVPT